MRGLKGIREGKERDREERRRRKAVAAIFIPEYRGSNQS
jgi:hypothetical protein